MSEIWSLLSDPETQQTLSWLGGGLAVLCGGLWAVLKFYLGRRGGSGSGGAPNGPIAASRGGIAAGRDVRFDRRQGIPASHLVLIVLALVGVVLFAVSQAGNRVSVSNGVGVGGNVEGSSITNK